MTGIEPAWLAWKARALPLSYIRKITPSTNAVTISAHHITLFHLCQKSRKTSFVNQSTYSCYLLTSYVIKIHYVVRKFLLAICARFIFCFAYHFRQHCPALSCLGNVAFTILLIVFLLRRSGRHSIRILNQELPSQHYTTLEEEGQASNRTETARPSSRSPRNPRRKEKDADSTEEVCRGHGSSAGKHACRQSSAACFVPPAGIEPAYTGLQPVANPSQLGRHTPPLHPRAGGGKGSGTFGLPGQRSACSLYL